MSQFATALELATYMTGTTDEADLDDEWVAQATALLVAISDDIEAAAGVTIDAGTGETLLPGTWSRDLQLPEGTTAVASVTVNGIALAAADYFYNDRETLRRGVGGNAGAADFDETFAEDWNSLGMQGATWRAGSHWGGPVSTVRVTRSWGRDEVPGFVKSLALRIASRTIGNVSNVVQESLAIYSVTYGNSSAASGSNVSDAERKRLRQLLNVRGGTITVGGR